MGESRAHSPHVVEVTFDDFGWESLSAEAEAQGVPVGELVAYAAMYYLADDARGTIARRRPLRLTQAGPRSP